MEKTLFRAIDAMPSWQLSAICVVLTEAIVSAMSLLFHGYVASDYLITGFVASLFVTYSILKILSLNRAQLEERAQAEEALRQSEARLHEAQRLAKIGSWELDLVNDVLLWSDEIFRIFEIDKEKFGASYEAFLNAVHPDDREAVNAAYTDSLKNRTPYGICHRLLMADGRVKWVEESCVSFFDEEGKPLRSVGTVQDITERKRAEEALRQSEARLQEAQKMDTAGRLAGGMAHDFNNLLSVIQGNLEVLLEKLADDAESHEFADRALHATGRSAELVNQLLVFSRKQFLQPQPVDVGALIGKMKDLLHSTLMEKTAVRISMPDDLWHALVDPTQLENAIINLALNARDAMPDGGTLSIAAENIEYTPDRLAADSDVVPGSFVHIKVADSGIGMPPAVLERAFEPFFTTKDVGRGSGLGLSMVYGLIKQSGGHIEIESAPNRGTEINLYLPKAEPKPMREAPVTVTGIEGAGETILIVEDDTEVRELAAMFLQELGYKLIEASDGHAALGVLKSDDPIDLLFTDVVMPGGISGGELARRALELRPGIKLLFATGYAEEIDVEGAKLTTGAEVLAKPYRKHQLARAVRSTLKAPTQHRSHRPARGP